MANRSSTKSLPQGVRIRNGAIQIYFSRNKRGYNVTLPHPPTAEGIQAAAKIRNQLITKAEWGILSESDLAEAKGIKKEENKVIVANVPLFQEMAQKYLKFNDGNLDTRSGYKRILEHNWMPYLALVPINAITSSDIKELIAILEFKTAKTLNNCLIPLRGTFQTAYDMKYISENPMDSIKNKKVQHGIPDPFSRTEMNALLNWLDQNLKGYERIFYWYYELAFWSGCRPSELIALRWNDVDWFNGTIRINKSRVRGIEKSVTKTHTVREVYLNDRSKRALTEIQAMNIDQEHVIFSEETHAPFMNERAPRLRLNDAMQACNIRHRPAYNSRHTYATMLLMDGVNPLFVAEQLGHSLQMLMKRYAKWMHGDRNKMELAKLKTD